MYCKLGDSDALVSYNGSVVLISPCSLLGKKTVSVSLCSFTSGMSIELVSLHSRMWDVSGIQICNNDLNDSSLENVADLRLSSENDKDACPETMAAPIFCPDDAKDDNSPSTAAAAPHSTSHAENRESLDIESDEMAKPSDSQLNNNGINEVHEMNVESNTCNEQSEPNGDVDADVSRQEPLLDVSGVETSDKNDDASGPSAKMNTTTETCETPTFANSDTLAGLFDQEKNAPPSELLSATMDADNEQAISGDPLTARDGDGDFNAVFGTEPLVRDDIFMEVAQESQLEFDEHNEMHSAILAENIDYSSYTEQQEIGFMENGRSLEKPEAHHDYMMGPESSGFNLHDQEVICLFSHSACTYSVFTNNLQIIVDCHDEHILLVSAVACIYIFSI